MQQMIKIVGFVLLWFFTLLLNSAYANNANEPLILSVHPYKPAIELTIAFSPLVDYLSRMSEKNIELKISKDYQTHIDLIGNDNVDIAYMGPAPYVKLVNAYGQKRLLARLEIGGAPTFTGVIITRNESDIKTLEMLKNKRFAFGSPSSTMSHLVPRYMLLEAGIPVAKLSKYAFLGNHVNVALGVLSGNYDAGAVKEEVYQQYEKRGLKILAVTPSLSEHLFVVSNKVDASLVTKLRNALLQLSVVDEGEHILKSIKKSASAMVTVQDSDYDNLREILKTLAFSDPILK